ncbi:hypothetical protein SCP_1800790 [Sparassis crispa]|uniref:SAM domain-containing protein n=1 Tax=Sparassis crispa TaxID=139825 RepID=A0A401H6I8_9APHY|nr:hypothetical protein SCP_1800790 [Sparassis crispa]GBE90057.1 hypothetical protein SCP_1800790 [Sparassis crispa]
MAAERALPTPPLPSSPLVYPFPFPTKRDPALQPNPHPYAVKTTTSALLTRSNSSGHNVAAMHHYYVPVSPNASRSSEHVKGHRPSKSQPIHISPSRSSPRPLPVPPIFPSSSPTRSNGHPSDGGAGGYSSADEARPCSRRARRADTLPSYTSPDVFSHLPALLDDLPSNPKLWTPVQLSSYLMAALRVTSAARPGESDCVLPTPVAKDIATFLRSRMVSGRTFLKLSDEDLQSMGMNKKWRQVLLSASHDLRQNMLKGRIWGTEASPSSSPGSASPAIPVDVFSNGLYSSSAPDLLADDIGSESGGSPTRYRSGRVRGMVESFERSGSFSSEGSFDGDEGGRVHRSPSNIARWLHKEDPIDEDPLRSSSPVCGAMQETFEPTMEELLATEPSGTDSTGSWGVRAWEEMDLAPNVTVKRVAENSAPNGTWVETPPEKDAIGTIVALENGGGKGSHHRRGREERRVVTAIFAPSDAGTACSATESEKEAAPEAVSVLEAREAGTQTDGVERPLETDWIVRENILRDELTTTRALLETFRARLEAVEQKVADLEQREHEREMEASRATNAKTNALVSGDAASSAEASSELVEVASSSVGADNTTSRVSLLPAAFQQFKRSLPMAIGLPSAPTDDDDNAEPSSVSDLPSYVLLVGLGVCAVVLRVVLRKVTGRGVGLKL